jgi:hypothetical protein
MVFLLFYLFWTLKPDAKLKYKFVPTKENKVNNILKGTPICRPPHPTSPLPHPHPKAYLYQVGCFQQVW